MALAIDGSSPGMASGTTATITTAAFTTPANVFLLALVGRNIFSAGGNAAGTVSGAGLTWTKVGAKSDYAGETGVLAGGTNQPGSVEIWQAYSAGALTSQTVSDARSDAGSGLGEEHALQVQVLTGAETTWAGAINATGAASGAPSLAITTTAANSWIFSVVSDWSASPAGTYTGTETKINEYIVSGQITVRFFRQTAATATSGTSVTESMTAPTAQAYNLINVEVRPSAGAVTPIPAPPRVVTRAARIRSAHF